MGARSGWPGVFYLMAFDMIYMVWMIYTVGGDWNCGGTMYRKGRYNQAAVAY